MIGNVPAGSLFAFLQSAGAGGEAAGTLTAMCAAHAQYAGMFASVAGYATRGGSWNVGSRVFECGFDGVCARM